MPAHRIRVVHPLPARGLLTASVGLGLLMGLAIIRVPNLFAEWVVRQPVLFRFGVFPWIALVAFVLLAPGIIWLVLLTSQTAHRRKVYWSAAALGIGAGIGTALGTVVFNFALALHFVAWPGYIASFAPLPVILAAGWMVASLIVAAIALAFTRLLRFQIAQQTGSLCWGCGYDQGAPDREVCSECGLATAEARPHGALSRRLVHSALRRGRWLLVAGVVVSLAVIGRWCQAGLVPALDLAHALSLPDRRLSAASIIENPTVHLAAIAYPPGVTDRVIWGRFSSQGGQRTLKLGLATAPDDPRMPISVIGAFEIVCELSPDQTKRAVASGIPDGLVRAMVQASIDGDWSGGYDRFKGPSVTPDPAKAVRIDPAPFFPASAGR